MTNKQLIASFGISFLVLGVFIGGMCFKQYQEEICLGGQTMELSGAAE